MWVVGAEVTGRARVRDLGEHHVLEAANLGPEMGKAAKYPSDPFLILGITNGESGAIGTPYYTEALGPGGINEQLAAKYRAKFFNVQTFLADLTATGAMAAANLPITDADRQCVARAASLYRSVPRRPMCT